MASNAENVSIWWRHHVWTSIKCLLLRSPSSSCLLSFLISISSCLFFPAMMNSSSRVTKLRQWGSLIHRHHQGSLNHHHQWGNRDHPHPLGGLVHRHLQLGVFRSSLAHSNLVLTNRRSQQMKSTEMSCGQLMWWVQNIYHFGSLNPWISKLPTSFEIHWVRQYLVKFHGFGG